MKYYIYENGQQSGPFSIEQLKIMHLSDNTNVWCEGMAKWDKAKNVPELDILFQSSTPPPPPFETKPQKEEPTTPCPDNHLTMAILATIVTFFCCSGIPIGIISLIYALEVENKWKKGLYDKAIKNSQTARTWAIVSYILAGAGFIIGVIYIFLIIGLEAFTLLL